MKFQNNSVSLLNHSSSGCQIAPVVFVPSTWRLCLFGLLLRELCNRLTITLNLAYHTRVDWRRLRIEACHHNRSINYLNIYQAPFKIIKRFCYNVPALHAKTHSTYTSRLVLLQSGGFKLKTFLQSPVTTKCVERFEHDTVSYCHAEFLRWSFRVVASLGSLLCKTYGVD